MCRILEVSKSGFYCLLSAEPSPRTPCTQRIQADVQCVFERFDGIYGSYKIAHQLQQDDQMESACRTTVAKAMQELGLKSKVSKQFTPRTTVVDPARQAAENLLAQDFQADAPNRKWVTDITYLLTAGGWIYLAVVLDLLSRKIVGWAVSDSLATPLVTTSRQGELRQPCLDFFAKSQSALGCLVLIETASHSSMELPSECRIDSVRLSFVSRLLRSRAHSPTTSDSIF